MTGPLCAYRRVQRMVIVGVKLGIVMVLLVCAVMVANDLYLKSSRYSDSVNTSLAFALNLPEDTRAFRSLAVSRKVFSIGDVHLHGSESSFFSELNVKGVVGRRPLLAGAFRPWFPSDLQIARMKIHLNTSYASDWDAKKALSSVLSDAWLQHMNIGRLSLSWGSEGNAGLLDGASCDCERVDGQWILRFKGGRFSYGPLQACEMVTAKVTISKEDGLVLNDMILRMVGEYPAEIRLSGTVSGGTDAQFDGRVSVKRLALSDYCSPSLAWVFSGVFQGEGSLQGSLGNAHGLNISLDFSPEKDSHAELHAVLPVLELLSVYEPKFRHLHGTDVSIQLGYDGKTGMWKADRLAFQTDEIPGFSLVAEGLYCRRMTDGEWFDLPYSPRNILTADKQPQPRKPAKVFSIAMGDAKVSSSAADNAMNVTRETPVIEGRVLLVFPRSIFPEHMNSGIPGVLELADEEGMFHLHLPLKKIVREISQDEADKIGPLLFRQPKREED